MNKCSYCCQIEGDLHECNFFYNRITTKYGLENRVVFETENWIVVPTIGAFIPGYLLAITKKHYNCIAVTPNEYYDELELIKNCVNTAFEKIYEKPSFFFEHGTISEDIKGSCCVSHTHLHMLPLAVNMDEYLTKNFEFDKNSIPISSFPSISELIKREHIASYLLYGKDSSYIKLLDMTHKMFPSQFFRQAICLQLGIEDKWDWRHHFFVDNINKTIQDLQGVL